MGIWKVWSNFYILNKLFLGKGKLACLKVCKTQPIAYWISINSAIKAIFYFLFVCLMFCGVRISIKCPKIKNNRIFKISGIKRKLPRLIIYISFAKPTCGPLVSIVSRRRHRLPATNGLLKLVPSAKGSSGATRSGQRLE